MQLYVAISLTMKQLYQARKQFQYKKLEEDKEDKKCKSCEKCRCGKENGGFQAAKVKTTKD